MNLPELERARDMFEDYSQERWRRDHQKAMECRDIEEEIRQLMDLFHQLQTAERAFAEKERSGVIHIAPVEFINALEHLRTDWLSLCVQNLLWVFQKEKDGYDVEGLKELKEAISAVTDSWLAKRFLKDIDLGYTLPPLTEEQVSKPAKLNIEIRRIPDRVDE